MRYDWGTWLDDEILMNLRAGRPHPRIKVPIDPAAGLFDSTDLGPALDGTDLVILAISSDGVLDVLDRAVSYFRAELPLLVTTKGFGYDAAGRVSLLPPLLEAVLPDPLRVGCPIVAIGGPCKANEVAVARPTATVLGCHDRAVADRVADLLSTQAYRVQTTDDINGVEASAAMKNVYAIALGVTDGLEGLGGEPWHNLSPDPPLCLDRGRPAGRANALLPGTITLSRGQSPPGRRAPAECEQTTI